MMRIAAAVFASFVLAACGGEDPSSSAETLLVEDDAVEETAAVESDVDLLAEQFVKLALAAGQHDPAFVDSYQGPDEWAEEAKTNTTSIEELETRAEKLLNRIAAAAEKEPGVRTAMLLKQARAALARIRIVGGETYPFDEETALLYDVVAPAYDVAEFDAALAELDALLPGDAPLPERVDDFRNSLAIPEDKLTAVFEAAIAECRQRTIGHYDLPAVESFSMEFVTDKPWSGYNWYQGGYESLIQVNTDFPIVIDRAVDLGCHEGYPGHHVWNVFIERDLLKRNGWIEYSVYALFSPMSVTAEGSANYGIELAFPGEEKTIFERDVLFPIAGLEPGDAEIMEKVNDARRKLSHAGNHVAREYLDGRITREEAVDLLQKYSLSSRERAEQRVRFFETYRGYVLNYNVGRDLIAGYVEAQVANGADPWDAFETLLTTPLAASDIQAAQ